MIQENICWPVRYTTEWQGLLHPPGIKLIGPTSAFTHAQCSLVLVAGPRLGPAVPHVVVLRVEEEDVELHVAPAERELETVVRLQRETQLRHVTSRHTKQERITHAHTRTHRHTTPTTSRQQACVTRQSSRQPNASRQEQTRGRKRQQTHDV